MKILVVEDYAPIRTAVVKALRQERYSVDEAADGDEGQHLATSGEYDVIVLDLMLPKVSGLALLKHLRQQGKQAHVILLTARDRVTDRVEGLDLGADDYLVKPFAMEELLARVRALLRREYRQKEPLIQIGHVTIRTKDHTVDVAGQRVDLTAKEYALLEYLARRRGELVTRADIWEHVYDERSEAASNVVDVYVGYLRKKLELAELPKILHTRRGQGYVLSDETP